MNKYQNRLKFLIDRSNYLYKKYKEDPIYIRALLIKDVNKEIIDFLLKNGHNFENVKEINEILDHFEVWYFQFIEKEKKVNALEQKFIFNRIDQATAYPKEAIETLLK